MGLNVEKHGIAAKSQRFAKSRAKLNRKFSKPYAVALAVQYSLELGTSNAYFEYKKKGGKGKEKKPHVTARVLGF